MLSYFQVVASCPTRGTTTLYVLCATYSTCLGLKNNHNFEAEFGFADGHIFDRFWTYYLRGDKLSICLVSIGLFLVVATWQFLTIGTLAGMYAHSTIEVVFLYDQFEVF